MSDIREETEAGKERADALDRRREREAGSSGLSQWFGVVGPPLAMLTFQEVAYGLAPWACARGGPFGRVPMHAAMLLALGVSVWAGLVAWRNWQRAGGEWPGDDGDPRARTRFLSALGVLGSAFFALIVVGQWVAVFVFHPCQ